MGLFNKDIATLDNLFVHTLQDIYYAENQILKALPKMINKVSDRQLRQVLSEHLDQTKIHVERLEQVFEMHGAEVKGVDCPAIDGIIKEADEIVGDVADKQVLDAANYCRCASGRALRDHPLRHPRYLGQAARSRGLRHGLGGDARRGEGSRRNPHRCRQGPGKRGSRVTKRKQRRRTADACFSAFPSPPDWYAATIADKGIPAARHRYASILPTFSQ